MSMQEYLSEQNLQNLELLKEVLHKSKAKILNEAVEFYFAEQMRILEEQKDSQTNLSYEEFWGDFEI